MMRKINNEELLIIPLINCGAITKNQCQEENIPNETIKEMKDAGYLIDGGDILKLSTYGKEFVKNQYRHISKFIYTGYIDKHDVKLAEIYFSLSSFERDSWVTRDKIQSIVSSRTFDGYYINTKKQKVCVSVLKKKCKKTVIQELEMTLRSLKADYPFYSFY